MRLRAAFTATRIAEWFRDQDLDVLLLMDSLTRFAMAQREVGLSAGEPPATRGYPPSVFGLLPRLLERAGASDCGSVTGLYTVLVEGDDLMDPIGDASRAILDGHIVLVAIARDRRSLPEHRRARVDLPARSRDHPARAAAGRDRDAPAAWPRTATPRTSSRSARTCRARARSSTAQLHSEKQWMASSDKTCMTLAPHRTRGPRSISLVGGGSG